MEIMKIDSFLQNGRLCWTLSSNGYKFMTWNFALMWQKACPGVPLLIVCADKPSREFFQREGLRAVLWDEALADFGPQIVPFGSRQFSVLNRLKLTLLHLFAGDERIQTCIYMDGDIAVYKNVAEDLTTRLLNPDSPGLLMPCDEQVQTCSGLPSLPCPNTCTGIVAFRHGCDGGVFKLTDAEVWKQKPEDQVWVNYAVGKLGVPVGVLPREEYPNGARLTLTQTTPDLKEKAVCLHYNYRVGANKKADMKRFGDWHLPY